MVMVVQLVMVVASCLDQLPKPLSSHHNLQEKEKEDLMQ
jgi:hypothetical protein